MSLEDKLREEMGVAGWSLIRPHHERGGLIVVSPSLDLATVGVAVATDRAAVVQSWMGEGLLRRSDDEDGARWATGGTFRFVIVQPFVLIQEIDDA